MGDTQTFHLRSLDEWGTVVLMMIHHTGIHVWLQQMRKSLFTACLHLCLWCCAERPCPLFFTPQLLTLSLSASKYENFLIEAYLANVSIQLQHEIKVGRIIIIIIQFIKHTNISNIILVRRIIPNLISNFFSINTNPDDRRNSPYFAFLQRIR